MKIHPGVSAVCLESVRLEAGLCASYGTAVNAHCTQQLCVCERGYPKTPLEGTAERGHCSGQLRLKILHRLVQDGDALTVPVVLETLLVPWLCLFCWVGGCDASVTLFSSVGDSTVPLNVSVLFGWRW